MKNNGFLSPDGWLSKRSRVCDWRTPENASKSPRVGRPSLFPQPVNGLPIGGLFRFCQPPQTTALVQILCLARLPLRRRVKRPFLRFLWPLFRRFSPFEKTADFPPNSPFSTSNPNILRFFLEKRQMDVKRKHIKIFSAEEQRAVLRCSRRRFQTSNTRYEMRKATFYKSAVRAKKSHLTSRLTICSAKKLPDLANPALRDCKRIFRG